MFPVVPSRYVGTIVVTPVGDDEFTISLPSENNRRYRFKAEDRTRILILINAELTIEPNLRTVYEKSKETIEHHSLLNAEKWDEVT
jgi:hypothetical protein